MKNLIKQNFTCTIKDKDIFIDLQKFSDDYLGTTKKNSIILLKMTQTYTIKVSIKLQLHVQYFFVKLKDYNICIRKIEQSTRE